MRQKVQIRMAEVGKSVNMTSELGVSFHSDKKREYKRMGKRVYGIRSFAYRIRMPQPQAAYAYRVYRILALHRFNGVTKEIFHSKHCTSIKSVFAIINTNNSSPVEMKNIQSVCNL